MALCLPSPYSYLLYIKTDLVSSGLRARATFRFDGELHSEHELHSDLMERTVYPTRVLNLELDLVTRGDSGVVTTGRGRICSMMRRKGSLDIG